MPAVTVRSSPNGLPIATTGSPTCTASESASCKRRERLRGQVDLQQGEVGGGVDADEGRLHGLAIREADLDLLGALDDVVVGDDVAVLVDHEAGAERTRGGRRSRRRTIADRASVVVIWTTAGAARS